MQSIITKYHGPGNVRGARVIATATGGLHRSYSWDHAKNSEDNHKDAAAKFAREFDWDGRFVGGAYNDKGAWIFVREWSDKRVGVPTLCRALNPHGIPMQRRISFNPLPRHSWRVGKGYL